MTIPQWRTFLNRHKSIVTAAIGGLPFLLPIFSATNPTFIGVVGWTMVAAIAVLILPVYAKVTIAIEDFINLKLGFVTPARVMRLAFAAPIVVLANGLYFQINSTTIAATSGTISFEMPEFILCMASAGLISAATIAAYHGVADRTRNIILAYALSIWIALLATVSKSFEPLALAAAALYFVHILIGALSDIRSKVYPLQGIGMFFGTFNPIHKTHLMILERALRTRNLDKIYLHATTIPKLHRQALANGELDLATESGMRVYHKTERADPAKNYFPTGNRFYEYELRRELLRASIRDAGLDNRIEVLDEPEIYEADGFFGLIKEIKRRHPRTCFHGLHGSDPGGIWVRNIFDHSGWIYPCTTVRQDKISATAIRNGATGMTSATVEQFLQAARQGQNFEFSTGYKFINRRTFRSEPQK